LPPEAFKGGYRVYITIKVKDITLNSLKLKFEANLVFNSGYLLKGRKQMGMNLAKRKKERICSTCRHYRGRLICKHFGKIKNPDCIYCSWWDDKEEIDKELQTKKRDYKKRDSKDRDISKRIKDLGKQIQDLKADIR